MKRGKKCGTEKEPWAFRKDHHLADGMMNVCKECQTGKVTAPPHLHRCGKCGLVKDPSEFHKNPKTKSGLRSHCKACVQLQGAAYREGKEAQLRERAKKWYEDNKEAVLLKQREYRVSHPDAAREYQTAHVETIRQQRRQFYLANADRLRAKKREYKLGNPDKVKASGARYRGENPDYLAGHRDKLSPRQRVSFITKPSVLRLDNYTCQLCGTTTKEAKLVVHHITPVAQAPDLAEEVSNLVTLCKECHTLAHAGCYSQLDPVIFNRLTAVTKERKCVE